jgi:hypothetical protein
MAKQLKVKEQYNHHFEYTNDIDRIVKIFANKGYEISATDAVRAWELVSNNWEAGWLTLHENDEEVFQDCFSYFEEV